MTRIFLGLYRWFSRHRTALYSILAGTLLLMLSALPGLRLDEDITAFLPSSGDSAEMADVFRNLKVSDRFVFMFSQKEGGNVYGLMEEAADSLMDMILQAGEGTMIKDAVISDLIAPRSDQKFLRFSLRYGKYSWPAVWWNAGDDKEKFRKGMHVNAVFTPDINFWKGTEKEQLLIKDMEVVQ